MKIDYDVPFYANTSDNTHCFQASLRMVLKYFQPEKEFSWEELEKITAKVEGLWTWASAGILWMQKNGFEVKNIELFDYPRFIKDGGAYLIEFFGEEVGNSQIAHSDIAQEQKIAKEFSKEVAIENRVPDIDELKNLLNEGFLVICNVNAQKLNKEEGYSGHSIVVKGFENDNIIIHDPGLPGLENRRVSLNIFENAWAYPNKRDKNIVAFKLKK